MKLILSILILLNISYGSVVQNYLDELKQEAKKENPNFVDFDVTNGEKIFTSKNNGKKGKEISWSSCHGNDLRKNGQNFFTGKVIKPLSRKVNPDRFSQTKTIKKWLKRNFNDVYNREGTAIEKGDVVSYILSKE